MSGYVQSATASIINGASLVVTLTGVSASNGLILVFAAQEAPTSNPTGFTVANQPAAFGSGGQGSIMYNLAPTAGTNTVTIPYAGGYAGACLIEVNGLTASPLDVAPAASNVTAGSTAGSNSIASGTLALSTEFVVAVLVEGGTGAGSTSIGITDPPAGFTSLFANQNSSTSQCWEMCYQQVSSTSSVTASWTWTDTATISSQAVLASFKLNASTAVFTPFTQTQFFVTNQVIQ